MCAEAPALRAAAGAAGRGHGHRGVGVWVRLELKLVSMFPSEAKNKPTTWLIRKYSMIPSCKSQTRFSNFWVSPDFIDGYA